MDCHWIIVALHEIYYLFWIDDVVGWFGDEPLWYRVDDRGMWKDSLRLLILLLCTVLIGLTSCIVLGWGTMAMVGKEQGDFVG